MITKREKIIGFAVALYSAAIYLALWLPYLHKKTPKGLDPLTLSLEGVAIALVLAITVAVGKRLWIGFAGMAVTFGPLSKYVILAMPAVAYAAIVGFKSMWQGKKATEANQRRVRGSKPAADARVKSNIISPRYTEPKSQKSKSQRTARATYGTLGRLGPGRSDQVNDKD